MTNRDRCISNLYALSKRKGILIRDLETSCGVSVGYLAHLRLDKRNPFPSSEFLFRAADLLETTVDALLHFDYQLSTETDQYLHRFINRLILDTLSEKLYWDLDHGCVPEPSILEEVVFPSHPLLGLDPVLLQEGKSKQYYASPFHPAVYDLLPRAAWRAALSENTVVFLTCVSQEDLPVEENAKLREAEMYLYNMETKALSPLCHSNPSHPGILDRDLALLCETISDSLHRTALDLSAISAIDAYMKEDPLG